MSGPLSNPYMFKSAATAAGFYTHSIANSIRVSNSSANSTATNYLYRDGGAGNRDTWTIGMWIKRARIATSSSHTSMAAWGGHSGSGSARGYGMVNDYTGTINGMSFENNNGSSWHLTTRTSAMYRDLSAWTHVCWRYDSTQSTEADRARMYVNGELITNLQSTTYPAQNADHSWNGGGYQFIGTNGTGTNGNNPHQGFDGYIAEVVAIDGTSLDPMDNLVETKNGVIIPKDPSGLTFGSEGFWLKFTNSSALGEDFSGNDNDFTVAGIATHDQMLDSPTNNFCTLNPLSNVNSGTLSEGNLKATASAWTAVYGTFEVPVTGSWYWEYISENHVYAYPGVQTITTEANQQNHDFVAVQTGEYRYEGTGEANTSSIGTGDIIAFWVNDGVIKVYVNNSLDHTFGTNMASSVNAGKTFFPSTIGSSAGIFNFGQDGTFAGAKTAGGNADANGHGNFMYTPKGLALCTANMSIAAAIDPAQTDDNYPQKLFGTLQYTGNNSERTIDTSFQIDKSWARSTVQGQDWYVLDTSRGYFGASSNNYYIKLNAEGGQASLPQYNFKAQSGSDITITGGTWFNSGSHTQQMWNWRLNGGTTAANTDGSVNSTVQVDPSGSLSIITYQAGLTSSGTVTVGHGLSSPPKFLIHTAYGSGVTGQRWVRSSGLTNWSYAIQITSNNAQQDKSNNGDMDVAPTSSVFTVNYTEGLGDASYDNVTYAFADCEGYIKSGKFVGNADADGTFIYLGFKPAFFWILHVASGDDPQVWDTSNGSYNPMTKTLSTHNNSAQVDNSNRSVDFLSNGVKIRSSNSNVNSSNAAGIIYLAMAHNPFKYATAR